MIHELALGLSTTGKTTLMQERCKRLMRAGRRCAVLDPLRSDGWGRVTFQTHDRREFLRWAMSNGGDVSGPGAELWIDESGTAIDKHDGAFDFLATTGRHLGHRAHYIAHRLKQLSPATRTQCQTLYLFRANVKDARELAEEYGVNELRRAGELPRFHFLLCRPCERPQAGRLVMPRPGVFTLELQRDAA